MSYILKNVRLYCIALGIPYPRLDVDAIRIYNAVEKAQAQAHGQTPVLARPYGALLPKRSERRLHEAGCKKCTDKKTIVLRVMLG